MSLELRDALLRGLAPSNHFLEKAGLFWFIRSSEHLVQHCLRTVEQFLGFQQQRVACPDLQPLAKDLELQFQHLGDVPALARARQRRAEIESVEPDCEPWESGTAGAGGPIR